MKKINTKSNVEVFIIGDIIAYGREHVFPIEKLRLLSIYLYISIPEQQKIIQFHDENLNEFPYEQSLYNSSTIKKDNLQHIYDIFANIKDERSISKMIDEQEEFSSALSIIAEGEYISEKSLIQLSETQNVELLKKVLSNHKTPLNILEKFKDRKDLGEALSQNTNCSPSLIKHIILSFSQLPNEYKAKNFDVFCNIAKNPCITLELMEILKNNPNLPAVVNLALNPNCPTAILNELIKREDFDINMGVLHNPNCPKKFLKQFVQNEDGFNEEMYQSAVAKNPNTPKDTLVYIATNGYNYAKTSLTENPKLSSDILDLLSEENHATILIGVASHKNVSLKTLTALSKSKLKGVRKEVIDNPKTSKKLLQQMLKAKENKCYELEILKRL